MASSNTSFKTREAYKAAKELEEARKAGTAPPAVDSDGKIINPHIPEYISQAPWYLKQEGPSLKHQRNHNANKRKFDPLGSWLPRGQFKGPAATKYRKGACENCGAMTHSAKTCLERPRRRGAKLTGQEIRPDEVIGSVSLDFEGKRDRWNGYDEKEFENVRRQFEETNGEVKKKQATSKNQDSGSESSDDSDDDAIVQKDRVSAKTTLRNLRIREDTAKYLFNLDLDSAYYDPKSRSMRADPLPNVDTEDKDFAGDNFVRYSGDVGTLAKMELNNRQGTSLGKTLPHLQAEPSRAEAVFREFQTRKQDLQEKRRADIIKKYGGQQHTVPLPGVSDVVETDTYNEYDAEGRAKGNQEDAFTAITYPEDVLEKNHKEIWGSFYSDGKWGYGCCGQTHRNVYCTGEAGKVAAIEVEREMKARVEHAKDKRDPRSLVQQHAELEKKKISKLNGTGEGEGQNLEEDRKRIVRLEREMRKQQAEEEEAQLNDRQRQYNSSKHNSDSHKISDEALEAYRLRRQLKDDPMAKFLTRKS